MDHVSPMYMVCFSPSIEQEKQCYNCNANDLSSVVWCSYNKQMKHLSVYRGLLTNRLHGKAAELRMFG